MGWYTQSNENGPLPLHVELSLLKSDFIEFIQLVFFDTPSILNFPKGPSYTWDLVTLSCLLYPEFIHGSNILPLFADSINSWSETI